jgi:hypothetical protein
MPSNAKVYRYDCSQNDTTPLEFVKWLRNSFGPRGTGWDFSGGGKNGMIDVIIWDDKLRCMFELWKL